MYCGKCGNFLKNKTAKYCGKCGNYVPYALWDMNTKNVNNNVIISGESKYNKTKKNNRQKRFSLTAVASIVLVVIVGVIMALSGGTSGSSSVVDSFAGGNIGSGNSSGTGGDGTPEVIQMKLRESAEPKKAEVVIEFCEGVVQFDEDAAKRINNTVVNYQMQGTGLQINVTKDSPLVNIPKGDVFFIPAGGGAAFQTGYIGKVVSTTQVNGLTQIFVEDPPLDEAFDYLNIDLEQTMTYDHVTSISALPGVTIKENVDDGEFTQLSSGSQNEATFLSKKGELETSDYEDGDGKLAFGFELDMLEYLGIKQDKKEAVNEVFDSTEASTRTVIITEAKTSYHISGCECFKTAKEANKISLLEAITEEYEPCELCNPPIVNNKKEYFKKNLKLTGSIGIHDLRIDSEFEWIKEKGKIETLYINATGKAGARVGIEGGMNLSIGGDDTKLTALNTIEMVGLKEKMLPIAFYNFTTMTPAVGKTGINKTVGMVPLSVGVLFYIDLSGKVSADTKMTLGFEMPISYTNRMFENGEMINDSDFALGEFEKVSEFKLEGSTKFDIHAGLSLPVYVFNLNIMEFIAFRTGFEASGKMGVCYKSVNDEIMENKSYCEGEGKLYLRAGELRFRLSVGIKNHLENFWNSLMGNEKEAEDDAVTFNVVDWHFESEPLMEYIFWPETKEKPIKVRTIYGENSIVKKCIEYYSKEGNLEKTVETDQMGQVNTTIYKYDSQGREIGYEVDVDSGSTSASETRRYNSYGDVEYKEYHYTYWYNPCWNKYYYTYEYDQNGRKIKEVCKTEMYFNGKYSELTDSPTWYQYDKYGNVISEKWTNGTIETEYKYEYDEQGNLLLEQYIGPEDGQQLPYTKKYTYDSKGKCTKMTYLEGGYEYTVSYEYDKKGKLVKEVSDYSVTTYEYDNKGNLIKEENEYSVITYDYDKDNQCVYEEITYDGTVTGWIKTEYYE